MAEIKIEVSEAGLQNILDTLQNPGEPNNKLKDAADAFRECRIKGVAHRVVKITQAESVTTQIVRMDGREE